MLLAKIKLDIKTSKKNIVTDLTQINNVEMLNVFKNKCLSGDSFYKQLVSQLRECKKLEIKKELGRLINEYKN
jgi:hypothetical protein